MRESPDREGQHRAVVMGAASHVFLSYVREDQRLVDRLAARLREAGVEVWLDREQIQPGQRWQSAIEEAIGNGAYFIACFSRAYEVRTHSYMDEEISLALDELRRRPATRNWFIPVLLTTATIPDRAIRQGETLGDLQAVELHRDWAGEYRKLLAIVAPTAQTPEQIVARLDLQPWGEHEWQSLAKHVRAARGLSRRPIRECTAIVGPDCCAAVAEILRECVLDEVRAAGVAMDVEAPPPMVHRDVILRGIGRFSTELDRLMTSSPIDCDSYKSLAELPIARYVNANFDDVLTRVLASAHPQRDPIREIRRGVDVRRASGARGAESRLKAATVDRPLVYHIYGHIDHNDTVVVTDDDFRRFALESDRDFSLVSLDILAAMAGGPVLVVGFQSYDRRLRELLDLAHKRNVSGQTTFSAGWFIQISPVEEIRHLAAKVAPLDLPSASSQHCENLRTEYLRRGLSVFWGTSADFLAHLASSVADGQP